MFQSLFGLKESDDLEDIFNLDLPVVTPDVYNSNWRHYQSDQSQKPELIEITHSNLQGNTGGQNNIITNSQFCNQLQESLNKNVLQSQNADLILISNSGLQDNTSGQNVGATNSQFRNQLQESLNKNLMECERSNESALLSESQFDTMSTTSHRFEPFSNLSFHSLIRRNIINCDQFQGQDPLVQQNESMFSSQSQETPVFSPLAEVSFHSTSQHFQGSQANMSLLTPASQRQNFIINLQTPNESSQFLFSQPQTSHQQQQNYCANFSPDNIFGSYQPPENIAPIASSIPKSILNLYMQIKGSGLSDWAFIHALSAQTCQEFTPMDSYVMLKTSLLLSIASINVKSNRVPIPIIAVGKDCSSANSMMNHIGNFAQRFVAPTDQIFNVSMKPDKFVEVGPVFLAKNGVCYLGNWSGLTKSVSEEIKIIIGSGRFFLNNNAENFQLGSAVWTYWSSTSSNQKYYLNVAMFFKYFGIPIVMDSDPNDTMIEFIFEEAINGQVEIPDDALNICYADMKTYLNIIRKIDVKTSVPAQLLLKSYFNAIRLDREDALSPRGSEIIEQMTESYAKMCFRDTVCSCDVVAVIAIVEKNIRQIIGVGRSPPPMLHTVRCIEEVDDYMKKFEKWVYDYVGMNVR